MAAPAAIPIVPPRIPRPRSARLTAARPGAASPQVVIDGEDGQPLAVAHLEVVDARTVRASLHIEPGHLPAGTRARLVDAVFDDPEVRSRRHLQVALPLGDTEIIDRVRQRGLVGGFRAAGSTCLVEAELP